MGKWALTLYGFVQLDDTFPALPAEGEEPAPVFAPGVDPGMVTYDVDGTLQTIDLPSTRAKNHRVGLTGFLFF